MRLNVPRGHAAGIEGDNLVIKASEAALPFRQNRWFKAGVTVAGNGDIKLAVLTFNLFLVTAVTRVASFIGDRSVLLMAEMIVHLSLHCTLKKLLGQLF